MAYDEYLAERIEIFLKDSNISFEKKRMMGGLCFMVDDKLCMCVSKDRLLARINPNLHEKSLKIKGCSELNITGKPMIGFFFVEAFAVDLDKDLEHWINLCLEFNPKAKRSRKS